jgi:hypothetical protein
MRLQQLATRVTALALIALLVTPPTLVAQLPGTPVLQNAWATPGLVVALDLGGGSGTSKGSTYAGAVAWAPGAARFQLSAGGGMNKVTGSPSLGVYGVRVAMPLKEMMGGNLGIGAFLGAGGAAGTVKDSLRATMIAPVGLAVGYRRPVGTAGRGFSVYADPNYQYQSGPKNKKGYFRVGVGLDAGVTPRFGLTVGVESGATAAPGFVGPHGSLFGVGASMKLGR